MNCHGGGKDPKDEVGSPFDADKSRGREIAESKIEDPVGGRCKGDGFSAKAQRE